MQRPGEPKTMENHGFNFKNIDFSGLERVPGRGRGVPTRQQVSEPRGLGGGGYYYCCEWLVASS